MELQTGEFVTIVVTIQRHANFRKGNSKRQFCEGALNSYNYEKVQIYK